jgi:hypothetical protein
LDHVDVGDAVRHLAERGDQRPVELDRADVSAGRGERQRQRAQAGADLDDAIAWSRAGRRRDRARQVGVDQEVLTERLVGSDAVARRQLADRTGSEPGRGTTS